ncbi:hypothetical protein NM688_g3488 [Phlebia brevispora]|uniref:Uncharacterized protein n=1 Tax=Phlebia brevispora TaxID=194682 RepID=A0ACC1T5M0_9APHY|nr:hypothetical protein NM688_g3488 [Phlebia brevispora]
MPFGPNDLLHRYHRWAHPQPFTTLVYQHHSASDLSGSSPVDNGRQYTTFQWRGTRMSGMNTSPVSLRQATQSFYANDNPELSPSAFTNSFTQNPQSQLYTFQLSEDSMSPGGSRQVEGSIGPQRRPFTRRRSARLQQQRLRGEITHEDTLTLSSESGHDLRSPRPRVSTQFISVTPNPHYPDTSDHSRDFENYPQSQFSSPTTSPSSEDTWSPFRALDSSTRPLARGTSPTSTSTSTISSASNFNNSSSSTVRRKKRVSSTDKADICRMHENEPELRQQDIAARYHVERSTISKILKEKERWLSIAHTERRTIYRQRDTKFPQLEAQMQAWLSEEPRPGARHHGYVQG